MINNMERNVKMQSYCKVVFLMFALLTVSLFTACDPDIESSRNKSSVQEADPSEQKPSEQDDELSEQEFELSEQEEARLQELREVEKKDWDFKPGQTAGERKVVTLNGVEFAFRWCPPGVFMMGSPESEHEVTLTKGFWIMETEVTQKQWKTVMRNNPSEFKGDDLPVEKVSLVDCAEFCKKCTEYGFLVQPPTEAQWEYACRAGTTEAYAGNLGDMAWFRSNSGDKTHPVRMKKPNAWGLYDMHGNVQEWCLDWYQDMSNRSETDPLCWYCLDEKYDPAKGFVDNPRYTSPYKTDTPYSPRFRVIRGGNFMCEDWCCRSASRGSIGQYYTGKDIGFRAIVIAQ